jgi:hypothetical protein
MPRDSRALFPAGDRTRRRDTNVPHEPMLSWALIVAPRERCPADRRDGKPSLSRRQLPAMVPEGSGARRSRALPTGRKSSALRPCRAPAWLLHQDPPRPCQGDAVLSVARLEVSYQRLPNRDRPEGRGDESASEEASAPPPRPIARRFFPCHRPSSLNWRDQINLDADDFPRENPC